MKIEIKIEIEKFKNNLTTGDFCGSEDTFFIFGTRSISDLIRDAEIIAPLTFGAYASACPNIHEPKIKASPIL